MRCVPAARILYYWIRYPFTAMAETFLFILEAD